MTKDIKDEPSEMELIRTKSTDSDFLDECDDRSRAAHEMNKERDYAELLRQRATDEVAYRDRARMVFECLKL